MLCLLELFSSAPDEDAVLGCVGKLIAFRQKRLLGARRKRARPARGAPPSAPLAKPFLWVITAGRPTAVLAEFGASTPADWPPGVYFSPGLFRTGIVVASELPRDRSTLLVRLMAAGPLLAQAIEELGALPPDAHERAVAEQILLALEHALGKKPKPTPEEQEFLVKIHTSWQKEREQGRTEGRAEGRAEQAARAVLTVLRVRGLEVRDEARERIVAETDPERLERWHERALVAGSIDEVFAESEPS